MAPLTKPLLGSSLWPHWLFLCDCVSGADPERADDEGETADGGDGEGPGAAAESGAGESPVRDTGGISQRRAAGGQQTVCVKQPKERRLPDPRGTHGFLLLTVSRNTILQKEKEQQREQHEQTVQKLLAKHELDVSHLHQEHALSAAKVLTNLRHRKQQMTLPPASFSRCSPLQASEVMKDFESVVAQLKQQLLESELQRQHQTRVGVGP